MADIEPGIYRIVNPRYSTAITVPAENTGTIVTWEAPNKPGQQWALRCTEGKYHISDCIYGRYIVADSVTTGAKVYLGCYPVLWEIIPAIEATWSIKHPECDLLIDLDGGGNGSEIHLKRRSDHPDRRWRFERIGNLPDDEPRLGRSSTEEKDLIIAQMLEQLAQQGKQLVELAGQLTEQNQKITAQEIEISAQKRQLEDKDRQLEQANREFKYLLTRAMREEEPIRQDRISGPSRSSAGGTGQGEDTSLRDEVERLKSRLNQLIHPFTL